MKDINDTKQSQYLYLLYHVPWTICWCSKQFRKQSVSVGNWGQISSTGWILQLGEVPRETPEAIESVIHRQEKLEEKYRYLLLVSPTVKHSVFTIDETAIWVKYVHYKKVHYYKTHLWLVLPYWKLFTIMQGKCFLLIKHQFTKSCINRKIYNLKLEICSRLGQIAPQTQTDLCFVFY